MTVSDAQAEALPAFVRDALPEVKALCRRLGVRRLWLFGSAAEGALKPESDLDFLVEFMPQENLGPADQFLGLQQGLEALLGRRIDLLTTNSLRNPYLKRSVLQSRRLLHAA